MIGGKDNQGMRVAIVDDNPADIDCLRDYSKKFEEESGEVIHTEMFSDGAEIVGRYREKGRFDVILLDIEMKYLDGMDTAARIRKLDGDVLIIFITNLARFAVRGYEVDALDFVVKPVSYPAFSAKLYKARRRMKSGQEKMLTVRSKTGLFRVSTREIIYIEVKNHSLHFHTTTENYQCTGSLKAVEKELSGLAFAKCNSCYLVHLSYIEKVTNEWVSVAGGERLQISGPKRKEFLRRLTDYYGGR